MIRMRTALAVILAAAIMLCGCDGGESMKVSVKINKGELDTANAASVIEMYDQNEALTDASIRIFRDACKANENSMVSPYSIMQAFSVCANGCEGKTREEIEKAFGCTVEELNEWFKAYGVLVTAPEEPVVVNSNAIWFRQDGFTPNQDYAERVAEFYGADSYMAPFDAATVEEINSWVCIKTKERIKELISELHESDNAVIVNAVTFDGTWVDPYEEDSVEDGTFTAEDGKEYDAKLMCSTESRYISGDGFTGFAKDYQDGYSFVAFLPEEGTTVAELMEKLDGKTFRKAINECQFGDVHAKLPKFASEYTADNLLGVMQNMGINALFSPAEADMSGMGTCDSGNLFIGDVAHKTFIDVNEKGTEAAAATGLIAKAAMMPADSYEVILDRPFIYAIVDDATGVPMFTGTCMTIE